MRAAMKMSVTCTVVLAVALAAAVGVAQTRPTSASGPLAGISAYAPATQVSGTIRVAGSPQMGDLLHLFEQGFRRFQPHVRFEESLKSTVTAVLGVSQGNAEIGLVGREVWPEEVRAFEMETGCAPLSIEAATGSYDVPKATFALMIVVNASNPVASLSREQLRRIFEMRVPMENSTARTWGDLGLGGTFASHPIHPYGFATTNDKSRIFATTIFGPGEDFSNFINRMRQFSNTTGADPVDAGEGIVRAVAADPDGIGISNVHYVTPEVRVLPLSSGSEKAVMPTRESVQSRAYLLARSVSVVMNPCVTGVDNAASREFLRFILSRDGQSAVIREGNYLPLTPKVVEQQQRLLRRNN